MSDTQTSAAFDDLLAAVQGLLGEHAEAAGLLKDMPVIQQALLQREADRLERKLGREHPRVQRLRTQAQDNARLVQAVESAVEAARVPVAPVAEDTVLLHGRVLDEHGRGLAGVAVSAEDDQGKALRSLGHTESDALGYFALPVSARVAAALAKAKRTRIVLALRAPTGGTVRRERVSLTPTPGERTFAEVAVRREDFGGGQVRGERARQSP